MAEAVRKRAREKKAADKLTPRQQRFVEEYVIDLNATRAAIRAGYSKRGADVAACRLLGNVRVQEGIAAAQRARSLRTEITADRVLQEIALLALSDIGDLYERRDDALLLRPLDAMPEQARRAIESITEQPTENGLRRTLRMHSKPAALKLLYDHLGLEKPKKHEHTGEGGKPIAVRQEHSLSREQTVEISAKILGVAKQLVQGKFKGPPEDAQGGSEA